LRCAREKLLGVPAIRKEMKVNTRQGEKKAKRIEMIGKGGRGVEGKDKKDVPRGGRDVNLVKGTLLRSGESRKVWGGNRGGTSHL